MRLWGTRALEFDWAPDAQCPHWDRFLGDVFPGDGSQRLLEEWIGYCMTEETRFQKGVIFVGPKRSGKGTIPMCSAGWLVTRNYVGLSFDQWTSAENSRQPMIDKRVGVFADVRLKPERLMARRLRCGRLGHVRLGFVAEYHRRRSNDDRS